MSAIYTMTKTESDHLLKPVKAFAVAGFSVHKNGTPTNEYPKDRKE